MPVTIEFFSTDSYDGWDDAAQSGGIYGCTCDTIDGANTFLERAILDDCIQTARAAMRCLSATAPYTTEVRVRLADGRCFGLDELLGGTNQGTN